MKSDISIFSGECVPFDMSFCSEVKYEKSQLQSITATAAITLEDSTCHEIETTGNITIENSMSKSLKGRFVRIVNTIVEGDIYADRIEIKESKVVGTVYCSARSNFIKVIDSIVDKISVQASVALPDSQGGVKISFENVKLHKGFFIMCGKNKNLTEVIDQEQESENLQIIELRGRSTVDEIDFNGGKGSVILPDGYEHITIFKNCDVMVVSPRK